MYQTRLFPSPSGYAISNRVLLKNPAPTQSLIPAGATGPTLYYTRNPLHPAGLPLIVLNNDEDDKAAFNGEAIDPYDWRVYAAGPAPK